MKDHSWKTNKVNKANKANKINRVQKVHKVIDLLGLVFEKFGLILAFWGGLMKEI